MINERSKSSPVNGRLTVNTKKKRWSGLLSKNRHSTSDTLVESPESDKTVYQAMESKPNHRRLHSTGCDGYSRFKKRFHLPNFSKQTIKAPVSYKPEIPEPIMPPLVDWSPETPVSPLPWEHKATKKRYSPGGQKISNFHSFSEEDIESVDTEDTEFQSDSDLTETNFSEASSEDTLVHSNQLRRRSSCPDYDSLSQRSSTTIIEKDILRITDQSTRQRSAFRNHKYSTDKKITFRPCQRSFARAAEAAAKGDTTPRHSPLFTHFCEEAAKYLFIPNVFDPVSHEPVLKFTNIKPRQYELKRKTSWKKEAKGLRIWHDTLKDSLGHQLSANIYSKYHEKKEKNLLTRNFILREFYTTEVNFWNQLYYTKIVFYDALSYVMDKKNSINTSAVDSFSNLFDLMKFSAKLIHLLRHAQLNKNECEPSMLNDVPINCNNIQLGRILCDISEDLVVFLRCSIDYGENKKLLQHKIYESYRETLYTRKETSRFTMEDYFIIPIQRVARYGLLLADLLKYTDPDIPDYKYLIQAHKTITSLATAMNSIQKKPK